MKTNIGNLVIVLDKPFGDPTGRILLGCKHEKNESDERRKRERVGIGKYVPCGGGLKPSDLSHKHGARRELFEEHKIKEGETFVCDIAWDPDTTEMKSVKIRNKDFSR